ncbi:MAG: MauE/DoxX family redox-associated membrane protein [Gammaproteobacteria bacterium]
MMQLSQIMHDPVAICAARGGIALLFALSALSKARHFSIFRATLMDYEIVPQPILGAAAALVLALEASIVLLVWVPGIAPLGMSLAVGLLLIYAVAIGINLLRGRRNIDCGCTGPAVRQSLSAWLLLRNTVLALVALIGTNSFGLRQVSTVDFVIAGTVILAATAIYAAANQLMANAPRLDALDGLMEAS